MASTNLSGAIVEEEETLPAMPALVPLRRERPVTRDALPSPPPLVRIADKLVVNDDDDDDDDGDKDVANTVDLDKALAAKLSISQSPTSLVAQLIEVDTFGAEYGMYDNDDDVESDDEMPELRPIGSTVCRPSSSSGRRGRPKRNTGVTIDPLRARVKPVRSTLAQRKQPEFTGSLVYDKVVTAVGEACLNSIDEIFLPAGAQMFQQNIMGRDGSGLEDSLFEAERFFANEYGLDFSSVKFNNGRKEGDQATLFGYMLNPKIDLRVYTTSACGPGVVQPRGCMKIMCGGWAVRLSRTVALRGRFGDKKKREGGSVEYPEGTFLFYGDYKIRPFKEKVVKRMVADPCDPCAPPREKIETHIIKGGDDLAMKFRSRSPLAPGVDLVMSFDNYVENAQIGQGVSSGTLKATRIDNNQYCVEMTETWKFPGNLTSSSSGSGSL